MREAIGKPQYIAGTLLLVFLAQCSWLINQNLRAGTLDTREWYRIDQGMRRWGGGAPSTPADAANPDAQAIPSASPRIQQNGGIDPDHSALWYLIPTAPLKLWPRTLQSESPATLGWLARLPYLFFGVMLGASLWYVARRLYGNAGGFIALTLYCFSPGIIQATAAWYAEPEIGAAWGAFGTIFTGIAVAHTLYAPREVVLWNWRRIVLLGVSIALALGSQYSLLVLVLLALPFMLYLAPARRQAAVAIWLAACSVASLLLLAAYGFHPDKLLEAFRSARWWEVTGRAFVLPGAFGRVLAQLGGNSPALIIMLPVALLVYMAWPRARYFGNTAPLFIAIVCFVLGWSSPHFPGLGFQLVALPFFFVFVAGVFADLLETRQRILVLAGLCGLLSAYALLNLFRLVQAGIAP